MRLRWMRRGVRRILLGRRVFDVCYDDLDGVEWDVLLVVDIFRFFC